jgi:hypothetical protein
VTTIPAIFTGINLPGVYPQVGVVSGDDREIRAKHIRHLILTPHS